MQLKSVTDYRNSHFLSSSVFLPKNTFHKIVFALTKLDENNLQVACGGH